MRVIVAILFLLFAGILKAQNADSTAIKLEHYKQLYKSNLINSNEYQRLKSRLLHIPFDLQTDADSVNARKLFEHYHARITGGAIMLGIGSAMITSEVIWVSRTYKDTKAPGGVILYGTAGGVSSVVGCLFLVLGLKDKFLFRNQYLSVNITNTDNQMGLACKF